LDRVECAAVISAADGDPADLVTRRVDTGQQLQRLRAAMAALPRHQRDVVELCVYAGLDQQAAAVALGVSVGTIKSRLHRARKQLARAVAEREEP
jgi:RNA polymerase sigma-70 factor (ECF subfamily)